SLATNTDVSPTEIQMIAKNASDLAEVLRLRLGKRLQFDELANRLKGLAPVDKPDEVHEREHQSLSLSEITLPEKTSPSSPTTRSEVSNGLRRPIVPPMETPLDDEKLYGELIKRAHEGRQKDRTSSWSYRAIRIAVWRKVAKKIDSDLEKKTDIDGPD